MANFKDNNADLGNQTIEGTSPPDALDAIIVTPVEQSTIIPDVQQDAQPVEPVIVTAAPSAAELDAQLDALINGEPKEAEPVSTIDLDAELEALMSDDQVTVTEHVERTETITVEPSSDDGDLDAMLNDLLKDDGNKADALSDKDVSDLNDQMNAILADDGKAEISADDLDAMNKQIDDILNAEPVVVEPQAEQPPVVEVPQSAPQSDIPPVVQPVNNAVTDEARAMMEQAQRIMEQAQQAQMQATAQMQAAHIQAQVTQAAQAVQMQSAPERQAAPANDGATEAAREMMRQAQAMLQQAQEAQLQAQRAAQEAQLQAQKAAAEAQLQAQAVNAARAVNSAVVQPSDPYAAKEVDRLKTELDGMRDLVNKLTVTLAQTPNGTAQQNVQTPPPAYGYNPDQQEQYRKLETELDRMRREILEKDLRDREKELDRRQKEAENNVKDIRPEMVQMSESREVVPVAGQSAAFGGEFIPLANGVFYSIKDKQVYVMTPASNAAAASPTIEPKRTTVVKKKPAARPARPAAKRRPIAHARRRPVGAPMHRRPPSGRGGTGRPSHR